MSHIIASPNCFNHFAYTTLPSTQRARTRLQRFIYEQKAITIESHELVDGAYDSHESRAKTVHAKHTAQSFSVYCLCVCAVCPRTQLQQQKPSNTYICTGCFNNNNFIFFNWLIHTLFFFAIWLLHCKCLCAIFCIRSFVGWSIASTVIINEHECPIVVVNRLQDSTWS